MKNIKPGVAWYSTNNIKYGINKSKNGIKTLYMMWKYEYSMNIEFWVLYITKIFGKEYMKYVKYGN